MKCGSPPGHAGVAGHGPTAPKQAAVAVSVLPG